MTETSPEPGRPVMTAREAGRVLRKDPRTIRRMIESGELAGGAEHGAQRRRWFVYADQVDPHSGKSHSASAPEVRATDDRLRADIDDLRGRLASSEETVRLLLASQSTMREALADYQRSVDDLLSGTTAFRDAAAHFQNAAANLHGSNTKLNAVVDSYSDALTQHNIPDNARTLLDHQGEDGS
ncbi:helix-turn-helix domain-containing protein [Rhodococcus erythropolis]|uniref:helix-turn-helix domain-containing protein n=1 Tax=Rhodococcus erythropolis TaxID=1833 RepID=UPI001C9AB15B|nr:helix-turn-helix domain-containing protein [Rhodococcus erythropolis]MBY6388575.1 helix-turn-helix domain-containing protein [Rhodococcus erythropolis]